MKWFIKIFYPKAYEALRLAAQPCHIDYDGMPLSHKNMRQELEAILAKSAK